MRIVFGDGAGCVQTRTDLAPLEKLGPVDFYDGPPPDRATLLERLRPAEVVILDDSTTGFNRPAAPCRDVPAARRGGRPR